MTAGTIAVVALRLASPVAWTWYTVIGSLTTLAAGIVVSALVRDAETAAG
jgi:hypothetical protein